MKIDNTDKDIDDHFSLMNNFNTPEVETIKEDQLHYDHQEKSEKENKHGGGGG